MGNPFKDPSITEQRNEIWRRLGMPENPPAESRENFETRRLRGSHSEQKQRTQASLALGKTCGYRKSYPR